ncbi:MAG: HAD family hydrolase, partial [Patescibacteria group bacterium]
AVWVFDLDGTLVTSNIDYGDAVLDFTKLMLRTLEHKAPYYLDIIQLEQGIDKERFKTMHADRRRFPGSLVEAYRELCRRAKIEIDPAVEQQVLAIGNSALSEETYQNRSLIPGAEKVLEFLLRREGRIFCVTFGDDSVQWMKWRGYNLRRFFPSAEEFRVTETEDKYPALNELRLLHPSIPALMVGDSIGSDIVPAVKAGYRPIFVLPPSVWDHGKLVKDIPPEATQLEEIVEIIGRCDELTKPTG